MTITTSAICLISKILVTRRHFQLFCKSSKFPTEMLNILEVIRDIVDGNHRDIEHALSSSRVMGKNGCIPSALCEQRNHCGSETMAMILGLIIRWMHSLCRLLYWHSSIERNL